MSKERCETCRFWERIDADSSTSELVYMGAKVYCDREETLAMLDRGQTVVIGRGTLREIIAALENNR